MHLSWPTLIEKSSHDIRTSAEHLCCNMRLSRQTEQCSPLFRMSQTLTSV